MLQLDSLTEQKSQKADKRLAKSQNYYLVGLTCMKAALDNPNQDTVLFEKASEMFIRAIRYNRTHLNAYLSLGYLLLMFNHPGRAVPYIMHVLEQDPDHEFAQKLKAEAQRQVAERGPKDHLPKHKQRQETDTISGIQRIDSKPTQNKSGAAGNNQKLQSLLEKELKMAQRLTQGIKVTHQLKVLQRLEQLKGRMQQKHDEIMQLAGDVLKDEGHPQYADLQHYDQLFQKLGLLVEHSSQLVHLQEQLDTLLVDVEDQLDELDELPEGENDSLRRFQYQLNQSFERYDTLADQLDALEAKMIDISALTPMFDQISQALGEFEEMVTDRQTGSV